MKLKICQPLSQNEKKETDKSTKRESSGRDTVSPPVLLGSKTTRESETK